MLNAVKQELTQASNTLPCPLWGRADICTEAFYAYATIGLCLVTQIQQKGDFLLGTSQLQTDMSSTKSQGKQDKLDQLTDLLEGTSHRLSAQDTEATPRAVRIPPQHPTRQTN